MSKKNEPTKTAQVGDKTCPKCGHKLNLDTIMSIWYCDNLIICNGKDYVGTKRCGYTADAGATKPKLLEKCPRCHQNSYAGNPTGYKFIGNPAITCDMCRRQLPSNWCRYCFKLFNGKCACGKPEYAGPLRTGQISSAKVEIAKCQGDLDYTRPVVKGIQDYINKRIRQGMTSGSILAYELYARGHSLSSGEVQKAIDRSTEKLAFVDSYVQRQIKHGCDDASIIYQELCKMGYNNSSLWDDIQIALGHARASITSEDIVSNSVVIQQIMLPYRYVGLDNNPYQLLGWVTSTQVEIRAEDETAPKIRLSAKDTLDLFRQLGLCPENVPGQKKRRKAVEETVSRKEWEMFLRFKEKIQELKETSTDIRDGWRDHTRYLQEEYSDYNKQYDEMKAPVRALPRLLAYITSGFSPSDDDDENDKYYDDDYISTQWGAVRSGDYPHRPRGREVVTVKIEDISTGDL